MGKNKNRLDLMVAELYPDVSRAYIQSLIMQGKVHVDGQMISKPGTLVAQGVSIQVDLKEPQYVSRAGFKLEKALETFGVDPTGLVIVDAGLSTGGFTDCLLQKGATKVYGIDVGYGQVHEKIRNDPRVVVLERTNLREVRSVGELVDLITLDLSFISITKVLDAVCALLKPHGALIILIKPQFEAGKHDVGRGGIVRDPAVHERVIADVTKAVVDRGFTLQGVIESPIAGTEGNKEFLAYFKRSA